MASYPGSVKTFTTKAAGNTIQPADVNDLQDEVNAIEAGILNGTAPLNSSNSTVANLSVTGGSTLTGNLQVNGNSSIAGNLVVTGTITGNAVNQGIRLSLSTLVSVGDVTWSGVSWDTEDFDVNGMHSTSVNSSRITFAASSGLYVVGATVVWDPGAAGVRSCRIRLNDTTSINGDIVGSWASTQNSVNNLSVLVHATSTADYVTLQVHQNTGGSTNVTGSTGPYPTTFWACRVSA